MHACWREWSGAVLLPLLPIFNHVGPTGLCESVERHRCFSTRCPASAGLLGDKAESYPFSSPSLKNSSFLHLRSRKKKEQALSSSSLTLKHLCSIQVRDRALVIDLGSFKSFSTLFSPSLSVVLTLERI
jgi:hypothetical protein